MNGLDLAETRLTEQKGKVIPPYQAMYTCGEEKKLVLAVAFSRRNGMWRESPFCHMYS